MAEGRVKLETGSLSVEELQGIFNTLPVDITFVDKDDRVGFYSETGDRIFVRTKAVIGRTVQNCHPEKSIHVVNQILDDFKNGKRDSAEFWLTVGGKFVYIRYFPVRDGDGRYLGCLEVTQDISEIKRVEGEKRLL
jgi:PAS domain S-box-containing protein